MPNWNITKNSSGGFRATEVLGDGTGYVIGGVVLVLFVAIIAPQFGLVVLIVCSPVLYFLLIYLVIHLLFGRKKRRS